MDRISKHEKRQILRQNRKARSQTNCPPLHNNVCTCMIETTCSAWAVAVRWRCRPFRASAYRRVPALMLGSLLGLVAATGLAGDAGLAGLGEARSRLAMWLRVLVLVGCDSAVKAPDWVDAMCCRVCMRSIANLGWPALPASQFSLTTCEDYVFTADRPQHSLLMHAPMKRSLH